MPMSPTVSTAFLRSLFCIMCSFYSFSSFLMLNLRTVLQNLLQLLASSLTDAGTDTNSAPAPPPAPHELINLCLNRYQFYCSTSSSSSRARLLILYEMQMIQQLLLLLASSFADCFSDTDHYILLLILVSIYNRAPLADHRGLIPEQLRELQVRLKGLLEAPRKRYIIQ
jgi:hypothetical protein